MDDGCKQQQSDGFRRGGLSHDGALPENRPVVNQTGLTGEYKFDIRWLTQENEYAPATVVDSGFTEAVKKQLGLILEKRTIPFDFLVIDHIESQPTSN